MSLSVVIPNYNSARTILNTLSSLFGQTLAETDIVVIDDHSTDNCLELIRTSYPSVIIYENPTNMGAAATRNRGFALSEGDWILCLDADVRLKPGCLDLLLGATEQADVVYPTIIYPNGELMYPVGDEQAKYPLISPVFLLRRSALKPPEEALFDETYETYCEDTDFFLRAYLRGVKAHFEPRAVAIHDVNPKRGNLETRYFLELRNSIYGAVKFVGIREISGLDHAFKLSNIVKVLGCGLFNFNLFDMQARGYRKFQGIRYNLRVLLATHDKITTRGSWPLVYLSGKALLWNINHFSSTWQARQRLQVCRKAQRREVQSA